MAKVRRDPLYFVARDAAARLLRIGPQRAAKLVNACPREAWLSILDAYETARARVGAILEPLPDDDTQSPAPAEAALDFASSDF